MFGYIRPYKPELRVKELEIYKSVYCGLCHTLGKRYSFLMRMILSYDATFLALLQISLSEGCMGFEKKRCPAKLFAKKTCCRLTGDVDFAADAAILLFYYKLRDNISDAGLLKKAAALIMTPYASWMHKKAAKRRPEIERIIRVYITDQKQAEIKRAGIDEAAHPTAEMMEKLLIAATGNQANERILGRMGYFIGRWVYIADAADDIPKDVRSGDYNPFVTSFQLDGESDLKEARERVKMLLNASQYEICAAYELLNIIKFKPILSNIFYLGMPDVTSTILKGEKLKPF